MDRDKVIKGLECCIEKIDTVVNKTHGFNCNACPYFRKCESSGYLIGLPLMRDAIALLKAQEPVKPTRYQEGRWFKTWRCGACGGTLVFRNGEDKPKYCTDCGKAVKWDA